jgi:hypothetical protein
MWMEFQRSKDILPCQTLCAMQEDKYFFQFAIGEMKELLSGVLP